MSNKVGLVEFLKQKCREQDWSVNSDDVIEFAEEWERSRVRESIGRPGHTAPKDGTPILGWINTGWMVVVYLRDRGNWFLDEAQTTGDHRVFPPSFWLPLPANPTDIEDGEGS